jgi:hypothetical protein
MCVTSFVSLFIIPACGNGNYDPSCPSTPIFFLVALGIYLSIYAATIWACVPPIVNKAFIASAFGFVYCIKNIGKSLILNLIILVYF